MQEAIITISAEEVQILNDIITNSIPSVKFGIVTKLIAKINTQLKEQFENQAAQEVEVQEDVVV